MKRFIVSMLVALAFMLGYFFFLVYLPDWSDAYMGLFLGWTAWDVSGGLTS